NPVLPCPVGSLYK
nr:RecName: Full=Unknown protein 1 [Ephedra distachya]